MKKWISIEEQMPPWGEDVLLRGELGMVVAYPEHCGEFRPSGVSPTYDMSGVELDIGKVTHWMPLPEPPLCHD